METGKKIYISLLHSNYVSPTEICTKINNTLRNKLLRKENWKSQLLMMLLILNMFSLFIYGRKFLTPT